MMMMMIMIVIMHDADADVMMIITKRWTNELTFSFVTQGVHGTPCLGEPSSVRRCAVPLRPRPSFSAGSHRLLCAMVTATSLIIWMRTCIFEVCSACSRSSTARLHRLCVRAPPSSRCSRMTLALVLEIFGRLVVSYLPHTAGLSSSNFSGQAC